MLNSILDGYRTITDVDTFTFLVLAGLVLSAYVMIKVTTDSLLLGTLFLPFLAFGGLIARYYFDLNFIAVTPDKDANTVFSIACGVLAAMLVMTLVAKLIGLAIERHWRNKHPGNRLAAAE